MTKISRRQFLHSALLSWAGVMATGFFKCVCGGSLNRGSDVSQRARRRRVLADLHVHSTLDDWNLLSPPAVESPFLAKIAAKLFNKTRIDWKRIHEAGIDLVCEAHYNVMDEVLSMPTDPFPEAPQNTIRMLDLLEAELAGPAAPYARLTRNHKELKTVLDVSKGDPDFRVAVVQTVEGGHSLGGRIEPLESFAERGVAMMTITHFFNKGIASSANALPFFPDSNSSWPNQGLSEFGAEIIKEMERLGMIVDVIHATSAAIQDVFKVSTKPLMATHSSVKTLGDHPYSLYDEHIQEIAHRGGMVGVILYPYVLSNYSSLDKAKEFGSLRDVVRSIRYITKICGTHKHVGIGSDFSGYITGPREMSHLSEIDKLRQMLLQEFGGDEDVVDDIMANNVIEFLLKNWRTGL